MNPLPTSPLPTSPTTPTLPVRETGVRRAGTRMRTPSRILVTMVFRVLVAVANRLEPWLLRHESLHRVLLAPGSAGFRRRLGAWRARVSVERAHRSVPAYRRLVDEHGGLPDLRLVDGAPDLSDLPETDKASYVQRFGHAERCVGGAIPTSGVMVDESSGSSGTPTSWLRGPAEQATTRRLLQLAYRKALGDRPYFVINAFALGAWATGLNVTLSLGDVSIMKSTGPDLDKITATMREFGPDFEYVVMGYPPFLKALADRDGIDWDTYRVRAVFGGEAMGEGLRDHLLQHFEDVLGSYGASDLEINIGSETPFTVALRRAMRDDDDLRARLADPRHDSLPMVFQYDPLAHYIETNTAGELVVTLNRPSTLAPKLRYNIHDLGHVADFDVVTTALGTTGTDLAAATDAAALPVLFLYGRSDRSVDYHGANVTPESVRDIVFAHPELTPVLESFRLLAGDDDPTLELALELVDGADPDVLDADRLGDEVFARLARVNGDFHNAWRHTATADHQPHVSIHSHGSGPFAGDPRIKKSYVADDLVYDPVTSST